MIVMNASQRYTLRDELVGIDSNMSVWIDITERHTSSTDCQPRNEIRDANRRTADLYTEIRPASARQFF